MKERKKEIVEDRERDSEIGRKPRRKKIQTCHSFFILGISA